MLVFRSLSLGLLGACFLLLATRPPYEVRLTPPAPPVVLRAAAAATIVDVAPGVPAGEIAGLIRLGASEHVIAVDDRPVTGDLDAGAALVARASGGRGFVDLTVEGVAGPRRVLVLLH